MCGFQSYLNHFLNFVCVYLCLNKDKAVLQRGVVGPKKIIYLFYIFKYRYLAPVYR